MQEAGQGALFRDRHRGTERGLRQQQGQGHDFLPPFHRLPDQRGLRAEPRERGSKESRMHRARQGQQRANFISE